MTNLQADHEKQVHVVELGSRTMNSMNLTQLVSSFSATYSMHKTQGRQKLSYPTQCGHTEQKATNDLVRREKKELKHECRYSELHL